MDAAGSEVGKEVLQKYPALVTNNTLEIHLYWAGRGTDAIPVKGVYGPLISAISVKSSKFHIPINTGYVSVFINWEFSFFNEVEITKFSNLGCFLFVLLFI